MVSSTHLMVTRIQYAATFFGCMLAIAPALSQNASKLEDAKRNARAASATYVGSAACSRCHLAIANSFAKASMGHSLTRITPEFLKTLPLPSGDASTYTDPKTGHTFTVHAENGKLLQTESEASPDGKPIFSNTHEMGWIIGTGENGFGALLSRDGFLFQAPLSYYSRAAAWRLSPNYEFENQSFNRLIAPACLYCHSGRAQPIAGIMGKYAATPFTQTSVGCENCHGPGSAHVEARGRGEGPESKPGRPAIADPTIVNPARLNPQLANELCMSCHQMGDTRVLQSGKTYQNFRPGEPLDHTFAIFQIPPTRENPPQEDHLEHYYSMSMSKCFRASQTSANPLRCISCHDPHVEPTAAEAPAYFNGKCLACHDPHVEPGQSCTAPTSLRQQTKPVADNCIACHMPQREIRVISHSSATNHRIVRTADEPFPDETFTQTTKAMPDLIHLNSAGARGSNATTPPAIIRLQAYADLMRTNTQYESSWRKTLAELETTTPNNALVEAALGHRDLADKKLLEAIAHLEKAIQLDPTLVDAYVDLSEVQDQTGEPEAALASAKRAVELAPFVPALQKTLVFRLINGKHYSEAQAAMEKYLATFPEDDFMRKMLALATQP
jgi:Cytochrome c554 and c-prime/Tetratricopeptide repeat